MAKIVFIQDNLVAEVLPWDGSPFQNPPGRIVMMVADDHGVKPGWLYSANTNTISEVAPISGGPNRIEKIDFFRLFTIPERAYYNALRKQVEALSPADYASTDPQKQMMVGLDLVFDAFDLVAKVELDHPETIQGVQILAMAGVFGPNPSVQAVRVAQVLAGQLPV